MTPALPPSLAARYEVLGLLGQGGMGTVWKVRDVRLGREAALKVLKGEASPQARDRFLREARVLAEVRHTNLVQVFDSGDTPEGPYLVMEQLRGQELNVERPPSDPTATMLQVADALETLHQAGIVHRDVKPANVIVEPSGRAVLLDMGLASVDDATRLTATGSLVGTLGYMAPELLKGREATPAADWYAWGVTLFELLEGQLPFSYSQVLEHAHGEAMPTPSFRRLAPDAPVRRLIEALLSSDLQARPARLGVIHQALDGTEVGEPSRVSSQVLDTALPTDLPTAPPSWFGWRGLFLGSMIGGVALGFLVQTPGPVAPPEPSAEELSRPDPSASKLEDIAALLKLTERFEVLHWQDGESGTEHIIRVAPFLSDAAFELRFKRFRETFSRAAASWHRTHGAGFGIAPDTSPFPVKPLRVSERIYRDYHSIQKTANHPFYAVTEPEQAATFERLGIAGPVAKEKFDDLCEAGRGWVDALPHGTDGPSVFDLVRASQSIHCDSDKRRVRPHVQALFHRILPAVRTGPYSWVALENALNFIGRGALRSVRKCEHLEPDFQQVDAGLRFYYQSSPPHSQGYLRRHFLEVAAQDAEKCGDRFPPPVAALLSRHRQETREFLHANPVIASGPRGARLRELAGPP